MFEFIDTILDRITMYRLMLYYLVALVTAAVVLSFFGVLSYTPITILSSAALLFAVALCANAVFAKTFGVTTNVESSYITALILVLVFTPARSLQDFVILFWAALLATAAKYVLAIGRKHLFNPAAIAAVIIGLSLGHFPNWWIGTPFLMPVVLLGGILVARKIEREGMAITFLFVVAFLTFDLTLMGGGAPLTAVEKMFLSSPALFFAFVMLTEPLTTPPKKTFRVMYAAVVAVLFVPQMHFFGLSLTPELALCIGNVFSYAVSSKGRFFLTLKKKISLTSDIVDFVFSSDRPLRFIPGQYLEWTLGHKKTDSRGNRRFFTLASAPGEDLRIGVKFSSNASSFKNALFQMQRGDTLVASQLAGEFTMPDDQKQKCVFLAGGIGVTPFRSMLQHLLAKRQARPIVLFYSVKQVFDIIYRDIFDRAERELGIPTIYILTDTKAVPQGWDGKVGFLNETMLKEAVPDYRTCMFYLSGPHSMVMAFNTMLRGMGVVPRHIKKDFFPGYA